MIRNFLKKYYRKIFAGTVFFFCSLIICIVLYQSYKIGSAIDALKTGSPSSGQFLSFLEATGDFLMLSSILIFLLALALVLVTSYFLKKQSILLKNMAFIRQCHERYRFFTETAPSIGILRFDLINSKVIDANRGALSLFGKTRASLVGKSLIEMVPEDERKKLENVLEELRSGRAEVEICIQVKDELDRQRFLTLHITNSMYSGSEPEAVAVALDVTDKVVAESERIEKERLAGVLEMAGATAHELNQPLQVISGLSWMILKNMDKNDPLYKKIETISQEVDRISMIANKISSISSYKVKKYVGKTRIIDIDQAASSNRIKRNNLNHA